MDDSAGRVPRVLSLENGRGVQYLIDEAYKITGNPLLLHNMEYELIARTSGVVTDDCIWNEIADTGIFSAETIKFFMEECFIDEVANSKKVALLTSDQLKYERLCGRVLNGYKNTVADLIMLACDRPLCEEDTPVFEAVCEKLSREIGADGYYNSYGILYHEKLIHKLLDAGIDEKTVYSGHLSNLYEDLKSNLYVAAVDVGECKTDENKLAEYRNLFKQMQPELKYAVYSGFIVIIASNDDTLPDVERDLHKLSGYFRDNNIRVGLSGGFDNLFNLREYYNEAVQALNMIG